MITRTGHISLSCWFHARPLFWSNWNSEMLVFVEGWKPENPQKNPWSKVENYNKPPTYDTWLELHPDHIGERRALSTLPYSCSPVCNKHLMQVQAPNSYLDSFSLTSRRKANDSGMFCLEVLRIGMPDELRMYTCTWLPNKWFNWDTCVF